MQHNRIHAIPAATVMRTTSLAQSRQLSRSTPRHHADALAHPHGDRDKYGRNRESNTQSMQKSEEIQ
ncbi:hypothetical protein J8I26_20130 [Herbaspirillum sp. LeCh32-8]|uniref:hypothetical protein n=1 Tax=Herbaspirillum sp. LeCh32-8 TaxID=2821356 RepID=UPI001AE3F367|nr:hypothetical protein [Herbaspirillum sp. LeCh32-8]MBP0600430.1 hypothetical protein [Herbaspirillum sp. LeCh32-8]